LIQRLA
jgi:hypothetical protein